MGLIGIAISLTISIILLSKTKKELNGVFSFKDAFTTYFIAAVIGILISTFFNIILFNVIDPAAKDTLSELMIKYTVNMLFERTAISKKPEETIINDLALLKSEKQISPDLTFRDPYFLDFLGLHDTYSEKDLESSILAQLQNFITEIGSEFAFLARQKRIIIDDEDFYIDLLFYHRGLRRLVVIDLKLGKFKAGYKGQMELYLRWLEKNEQKEGENKPIGLILCSEKSPEQINYLMLDNDDQIKVSAYLTQLPEKKLLLEKLERAIAIAENNIHNK